MYVDREETLSIQVLRVRLPPRVRGSDVEDALASVKLSLLPLTECEQQQSISPTRVSNAVLIVPLTCSKSHEAWTRAVPAAIDEPFEWHESLAFLGVAQHELKRSVLEARVVLSAADLKHTRTVAQCLVPLHGACVRASFHTLVCLNCLRTE